MFLQYTVLKGVPSLNKVVFAKKRQTQLFLCNCDTTFRQCVRLYLARHLRKCSFSCKYSYAVRFLQSFLRK